jgi:hypothetical protein
MKGYNMSEAITIGIATMIFIVAFGMTRGMVLTRRELEEIKKNNREIDERIKEIKEKGKR